jgi:lysophospholipase
MSQPPPPLFDYRRRHGRAVRPSGAPTRALAVARHRSAPTSLLATVLAVLSLGGCRAHDPLPKQPAIDLAQVPGPSPAELSSEGDLPARLAGPLAQLWASGQEGEFVGVDGVTLRYHLQLAPAERGAIIVLPGRTEAAQKYVEVTGDLVAQGYSVYVLDHRGQGASGRLLPNREMGHVEFFRDYVDDLERFIDEVVRSRPHPRLFVLAHSMGGAVAAYYIDRHPDAIDAAVLGAPMFEIDTGGFPTVVAGSIAGSACSLTSGSGYAAGMKDYTEEASVAESTVTQSAARWQAKIDLYRARPELRLGGPTYRWVCESLQAASRAQGLGPFSHTPTLLLQAGDDSVVKPGGQRRYCEEAPRCQLQRFDRALHELFMERDEVRNLALSQAIRFFNHAAGVQ